MCTQKKRREKPNLVAQAKIFHNHHFLLLARSYEQYEAEKQSYLETGLFVDSGPVELLMRCWPVLDSLIQLPNEPNERDFLQIAYSSKVFKLTNALDDIENTFLVFKRSIDFQTVTSKKIDSLLVEPRIDDLGRYLLTKEQQSYFQSLAFDVEMWCDNDQSNGDFATNLVSIYLSIQDEIDEFGRVTKAGRKQLEYLKSLLAGTKRQRLYAESVLVMMLAEFYEQKNTFGNKAVMKRDPTQPSKEWYDSIADENKERDKEGVLIPWSPKYISPFCRFLDEVLAAFDLGRIGMANAEKITKNRKKLKSNKVLHLCKLENGEKDLTKLFQMLDRVKP